jgi:uncharacterized protein YbjT (DUF2867 family)
METENARGKGMTLVLGGTGKTGRRVAERLEARDAAATGIWDGGR